jgi:hypothetical protein
MQQHRALHLYAVCCGGLADGVGVLYRLHAYIYIYDISTRLHGHMRFKASAVCSFVALCCIQSGGCIQGPNAGEVYDRVEMIEFEVQQAFRKISNLAKSRSSIGTQLEGELQGYALRAI